MSFVGKMFGRSSSSSSSSSSEQDQDRTNAVTDATEAGRDVVDAQSEETKKAAEQQEKNRRRTRRGLLRYSEQGEETLGGSSA